MSASLQHAEAGATPKIIRPFKKDFGLYTYDLCPTVADCALQPTSFQTRHNAVSFLLYPNALVNLTAAFFPAHTTYFDSEYDFGTWTRQEPHLYTRSLYPLQPDGSVAIEIKVSNPNNSVPIRVTAVFLPGESAFRLRVIRTPINQHVDAHDCYVFTRSIRTTRSVIRYDAPNEFPKHPFPPSYRRLSLTQ